VHKIIEMPVGQLIQYARNPRKNDHAVAQIASAIKEFGFRVPIIAKSDGTVIDGHLRLKAAMKLGLEKVPVVLADDMTETQIKAFRISVNRMAELAQWDTELLALEMEDLRLDGYDLNLTGFDMSKIDEMFGQPEDDGGGGTDIAHQGDNKSKGSLSERFMLPPFTVLNAREGWWQDRKRAWLALGIKSELGRGENGHHAAPGGSPMVAGYSKDGKRLTGLKNIGGRND